MHGGGGDVLDAFHQLDQPLAVSRLAGRETDAAIAHDRGGDAVPGRGREMAVPHRLAIIMGVEVDEAGRDDLAPGIDLLGAARRRPCRYRRSAPSLTATSASKPGLPVPSNTVPPRMTRSTRAPCPLPFRYSPVCYPEDAKQVKATAVRSKIRAAALLLPIAVAGRLGTLRAADLLGHGGHGDVDIHEDGSWRVILASVEPLSAAILDGLRQRLGIRQQILDYRCQRGPACGRTSASLDATEVTPGKAGNTMDQFASSGRRSAMAR